MKASLDKGTGTELECSFMKRQYWVADGSDGSLGSGAGLVAAETLTSYTTSLLGQPMWKQG